MLFNIGRVKFISNSVTFSHYWNPTRSIHNVCSIKNLFKCRPGTAKFFNSNFHTTHTLNAKTFQEHENEYAHEIMENLPVYCNSIVKTSTLKSIDMSCISSNTVRKFSQVSLDISESSVTLENIEFSGLVKEVSKCLLYLNDHDFVKVLHSLCLWPPSPKSWSPNFKLLWNTIDEECCVRLSKWELDQKLLVADYFFGLRLNRISKYNRNLITDLISIIDSLSDHHVVQLMFCINLQRKVPFLHNINNSALLQRLLNLVNLVSIQELGIVCLAFFKTEIIVKNPIFIRAVIKRFIEQLGQTEPASVAAILKFLRKSMCFEIIDDYIPLLHKCVGCIPSWDVLTAVHTTLLASECRVYHPLLLDTVTRHVTSHLSAEARIKDCVKLLQAFSTVGHNIDQHFLNMFFVEVKKETRRSEMQRYKRDLVHASLFCAYFGYYDLQVINTILEPSYVRDFLTKYPEMEAAITEVDCCVEIECPDYKGPRLPQEHRQVLIKRQGNLPKSTSEKTYLSMRLILETLATLKELGLKEDNFLVRHIMPHCFSPDIILRLNPSTSESLADICSKISPQYILYPPYKNEKWISLVVASSFSFTYRSKKLTGATQMRLRQLSILGYKTVFLPYFDISRDPEKRLGVFEKILRELNNDCNTNLLSEIK